MSTFPFYNINNLPEISFIGGTSQDLFFDFYNSASAIVDLSGGSFSWYLSYYGTSTQVVTKAGALSGSSTNIVVINLVPNDTINIHGKFFQQIKITDSSGSVFRPSQGIVNISPAFQ